MNRGHELTVYQYIFMEMNPSRGLYQSINSFAPSTQKDRDLFFPRTLIGRLEKLRSMELWLEFGGLPLRYFLHWVRAVTLASGICELSDSKRGGQRKKIG
jgi:hypothetical protein